MRWPMIGFCFGMAGGAGFALYDQYSFYQVYRDTVFASRPDLIPWPQQILFEMVCCGLLAGILGLSLGCFVAAVTRRRRPDPPVKSLPGVGPRWSERPSAERPSSQVQPAPAEMLQRNGKDGSDTDKT